jgi:hypothetical protein
MVYVGSTDNRFYALNSDGTFYWSFMTSGCIYSSPSIGSSGEIYFGSDDLVFYCIKQAPTETPTITPTPTDTLTPTLTPTPTNSPTPTDTPIPTVTPSSTIVPTGAPTLTPTTTPIPPLIVRPGELIAGQGFSVYLALTEDITQPFDFYFFVNTPAGDYTLYFDGKIDKGIKPLYKNVQSFTKDYITTVQPAVKMPAGMSGKTVTFYAAFIQAGKKTPVTRVSDLAADTAHVILMDKASAVVGP